MNKKSLIKNLISLTLLFSFFTILTFASEIVDYQGVFQQDKPTAKFSITNLDTSKSEISNFTRYEKLYETGDMSAPTMKATIGDEWKITDLSTPGKGTNDIEMWDLQIFKPNGESEVKYITDLSEVEKIREFDQTGTWKIYLCVKDSAEPIVGVKNWSDNGNHYTIGTSETTGISYYWYFTELKVEVREYEEVDVGIGLHLNPGWFDLREPEYDANVERESEYEVFSYDTKTPTDNNIYEFYLDDKLLYKGRNDRYSGTLKYRVQDPDYSFKLKVTNLDSGGSDSILSNGAIDINVIGVPSDIEINASITDVPETVAPDVTSVDGTLNFTITSTDYPIKKWSITEGTEYVDGNTSYETTLSESDINESLNLKDVPLGSTPFEVTATDIKGGKAIKRVYLEVAEKGYDPETKINVDVVDKYGNNQNRSRLYPKLVTDTGDFTNLITWDYSDANGDDLVDSEIKVYKIEEDGTETFVTKSRELDRKYEFTGIAGNEYKLEVEVENDLGERDSDFKFVLVSDPKPSIMLDTESKTYINEDLDIIIDDYSDRYPNKYYPITFEDWKIEENFTFNEILKSSGKLPVKINMSDEFFEENKTYVFSQKVSNEAGNEKTTSKVVSVLEALKPTIDIMKIEAYYGETLDTNINIYQEYEEDSPSFNQIFNDKNTYYKIYNPDGTVKEEGEGWKETITIDNTYQKPDKWDITYRYEQFAKNSKGKETTKTVSLVIKKPVPPEITLKINERDSDPLTIKNEIYKSEHLDITDTVTDNHFNITESKWRVEDSEGNIVLNDNGTFHGLKKITLDVGEYTLFQYAKNEMEKEDEKSVDFKVKMIERPFINVLDSNINVNDSSVNTFYEDDVINLKLECVDINKSEEHPDGFTLNSDWTFTDELGNTYFNKDEVLNGNINVDSSYTKGRTYYITQNTENIVYTDINRELKVEFRIENRPPIITVDKEIGDGVDPDYVLEEIRLDVNIEDLDGEVKNVVYEVDDSFTELKKEETGINTSNYNSNLEYKPIDYGIKTLKIIATDDKGAVTEKVVEFSIEKPTTSVNLSIKDEDTIKKKENRYIEFNISTYTDSIYSIDKQKTTLEYSKDGGKFISLIESKEYEDENIRVNVRDLSKKEVIETYFKESGTYKIRARCENIIGYESDFKELDLNITEDLAPTSTFQLETSGHRITKEDVEKNANEYIKEENINKAYFNIIDNAMSVDGDRLEDKTFKITYDSDNDEDYSDESEKRIMMYESDSGTSKEEYIVRNISNEDNIVVENINNYKLAFLTAKKGLGRYKVKLFVREEIEQLPESSSPLYDELINKGKTSSEEKTIFIDNLAPKLSFDVTGKKKIRLIIHFDNEPTEQEEQQLNEIVTDLKQNGMQVEVIKKYGIY